MDIQDVIDSRKEELIKKESENAYIEKEIQANLDKLRRIEKELALGQPALQFLENLANTRRGSLKDQIEEVITSALHLVYGSEYKVELRYDIKNNRSFVDIELVKSTPEGDVRRLMNGFGGGVSDTISVPLRLLVLIASREVERICILDECYKHMDVERIDSVMQFLRDVCRKLDVQIVMSSHHEAAFEAADGIYHIKDEKGVAVIEMYK